MKTPEGVVLIDAGMDSTGGDVHALLEAMQVSVSEVRAVLLTHWHNDHAAGAKALRAASGCEVGYHLADEPWLTRATAHPGWRDWISKRIPEWGIGILFIGLLGEAVPEAVDATLPLEDEQIVIGGFEVIATPGHTPGHVSFYWPQEKVLFAGDALAVIGGRVRFMSRPVTMDVPMARVSMEKCLSREITVLCPGHREPLTEGVAEECARMQEHLASDGHWPLFG